jgi:hypothetical protein
VRLLLLLTLIASIAQQPPPAQNPPVKPAPPGTAQTPPGTAQTPAGASATPVQGPYEFTSDLGVFLIVVKAEKAAAFDTAVAKLKQAFMQSTNATRKQQATGFRVLKSTETPAPVDGAITYLFFIDPVVKQTSYDPIVILRESLPNDVQSAYDQFSDAIVSMTRIGMKELMKMSGG